MKEVSLDTIADGVAKELFQQELAKIAENVADQNSAAKTKRTITLTFEFSPDEDREEMKIVVASKSKLAPIKPYAKTAWLGKRNGKFTVYGQDTKQVDMFDEKIASMQARKDIHG